MIIALVTEFDQDAYFQWRMVWDDEAMIKHDVFVKSVRITPDVVKHYPSDSKYWYWLKKADVVFVYASRAIDRFKNEYDWWELPRITKQFMNPEAKLIAQWDQEFIWVFHPRWSWWADYPIDPVTKPEDFFKNTKILDYPDAILTVLEKPLYQQYINKPIHYLPLPQMTRYDGYSFDKKPIGGNVALMRHLSISSRARHTIENVIKPTGIPTTYFINEAGLPQGDAMRLVRTWELPKGSEMYGRIVRSGFVDLLFRCHAAIDDSDNYIGWSRFCMECAITFTPCIGSNYANKIFFPELYTEHRDYEKQKELLKQLYSDRAFHKKIALEGYNRLIAHMDNNYLCSRLIEIAKEIGTTDNKIDIQKLLYVKYLADAMSQGKHIPPRPVNGMVYDNIQNRILTRAEWENIYSKWEKFFDDQEANTLARLWS